MSDDGDRPSGGDGQPIEREEGREYKHPQMPAKAKKITVRRGEVEREKIAVFAKEEYCFASLGSGEPVERKRWRKITELSQQESTEVLFALAEAHGYNLEPK